MFSFQKSIYYFRPAIFLPSVYGIVNGEVSIKEIRDVTVEDLLPRDEISLSIEEISGYLKGETILVTGEEVPLAPSFAGK